MRARQNSLKLASALLALLTEVTVLMVFARILSDKPKTLSTNPGVISTNYTYGPLPIALADLYQSGATFDQTFWKQIVRTVVNYDGGTLTNMREPLLAGILSLLIPGLGQIYNGRILIGIIWLVLTGFSWIGSAGLLGWVVHIIAAWCAYSYAKDNPIR